MKKVFTLALIVGFLAFIAFTSLAAGELGYVIITSSSPDSSRGYVYISSREDSMIVDVDFGAYRVPHDLEDVNLICLVPKALGMPTVLDSGPFNGAMFSTGGDGTATEFRYYGVNYEVNLSPGQPSHASLRVIFHHPIPPVSTIDCLITFEYDGENRSIWAEPLTVVFDP